MKTITYILGVLAIASVLYFTTGCRTASNPSGVVSVGSVQIDPQLTADAVGIAAQLGGLQAIKADPSIRPYFLDASIVIGGVIASGNTSPTNVAAALQGITSDATITAAISDALKLYGDYYGKAVTNYLSNASPYTVPVLTSLATGLNQAYTLSAQ